VSDALLADYPVRITLPVAWGEMDAMGHVNNVVYLRWFESVRMVYLERIGLMAHMQEHGIGPILAETRCRFRIPLEYPDEVEVGARVAKLETDRFLMEYAVASRNHGRIAAEGDGLIVTFDYDAKRKAPVPEAAVAAIGELEGGRLGGPAA
jgi:acyl-CoA thioester hydrolase